MITVHHLEYSQSFRIVWLMEELGNPYELKLYYRDEKTMLAPDEYKALSPLGTAPVITDGDLALAETSAIIDYILDGASNERLRPVAGSPERAQYLFWFHAAQGSLMPLMLIDSVFAIGQTRVPFLIKPIYNRIFKMMRSALIEPRMKALMNEADKALANGYFAGSALTAADICLSYPMFSAIKRGYARPEHENIHAWHARIQALPSFMDAKEKDEGREMLFSL